MTNLVVEGLKKQKETPIPIPRQVMTTPKVASQKSSKDLKFKAKSPIIGVKNDNIIKPMADPRNDPVVAMPIALPA